MWRAFSEGSKRGRLLLVAVVLQVLAQLFVFVLRADDQVFVFAQTGSGRDLVSYDDVFLQAFEVVFLGSDGCFVEHLGRFLEGSGRDERVRLQRSPGDTLQHRLGRCGDRIARFDLLFVRAFERGVLVLELTQGNHLSGMQVFRIAGIGDDFDAEESIVGIGEVAFVDGLAFEELRVARVDDHHLAHHLADDHFEVFVVDHHALHPVHSLYFVYQVFLNFVRAFDAQDVVRGDRSFGQRAAGTDVVVVLNEDLVGEFDQVAALFTALGGDDDLLVAALDGSQTYYAVDLGNNGRVGRVARLEELR